jgi:hypothetical protein
VGDVGDVAQQATTGGMEHPDDQRLDEPVRATTTPPTETVIVLVA